MIETNRQQHLVYQSGDLADLTGKIRATLTRNYPTDSLTARYLKIERRADARHTRRLAAWARVINSSPEEFDRLDQGRFLDEVERMLGT